MEFEAILYLAVLVLAAKLFGELMHRINQPAILGNVIAGIVVGPALFASHIAVRIAKLKPSRTVAYGLMAKGAVDLALLLTLLEASIIDENLFSLLVLGTMIMMILSSVGLQRNLQKILPSNAAP